MAALSLDLRIRILAAHQSEKYSVPQIAKMFTVAKVTVRSLVRLWLETGNLAPRKVGPTALPIWTDTALHEIVRNLVMETNDATLEEYCSALETQTGTRISVPQMCELLQQLKIYRKKNSSRYRRELREDRAGA